MTKATQYSLALYLLIVQFVCDQTKTLGQTEIKGSLKYTLRDESAPATVRLLFDVKIDGCHWLIHTVQESRVGVQYYEVAYDGTNIFSYSRFNDDILNAKTLTVLSPSPQSDRLEEHLGAPSERPHNVGIGRVEMNDVPEGGDGSFAAPLWLAYCSGCYFENIHTNRIKPVWHLEDPSLRSEGFTVEATWKLCPETPHLPTNVDYHNDGSVRLRTPGGSQLRKWWPPFDRGFLEAAYEASLFTNCDNIYIPMIFKFRKYQPKSEQATNQDDLILQYVIEARVDSISSLAEFSPTIALNGTTWINDFRVMALSPSVDVIQYERSNTWLTAQSTTFTDLYKSRLETISRQPKDVVTAQPTTKRWIVIACMISISIFPAVVWFKNWRKSRTR